MEFCSVEESASFFYDKDRKTKGVTSYESEKNLQKSKLNWLYSDCSLADRNPLFPAMAYYPQLFDVFYGL